MSYDGGRLSIGFPPMSYLHPYGSHRIEHARLLLVPSPVPLWFQPLVIQSGVIRFPLALRLSSLLARMMERI